MIKEDTMQQTNYEKYEVIKDISKALKKNFKMDAFTYGYCCSTDYDADRKRVNYEDFVNAKIYKGGNNNQYRNGQFEIEEKVWYNWELTHFSLDDVLAVMQKACEGRATVKRPENSGWCIELEFAEVN